MFHSSIERQVHLYASEWKKRSQIAETRKSKNLAFQCCFPPKKLRFQAPKKPFQKDRFLSKRLTLTPFCFVAKKVDRETSFPKKHPKNPNLEDHPRTRFSGFITRHGDRFRPWNWGGNLGALPNAVASPRISWE